MKKILFILCIIAGILYASITHDVIVLRLPGQKHTYSENLLEKKLVTLHYYTQGQWHQETVDIIWAQDTANATSHLVERWLALLDEEQVTEQKIVLQSVICAGKDLYISFDQVPFAESDTYTKWMWVEGLLKTIRDTGIKAQGVYLLVHHQQLEDPHLDFSHAWPLIGFMHKLHQ